MSDLEIVASIASYQQQAIGTLPSQIRGIEQ